MPTRAYKESDAAQVKELISSIMRNEFKQELRAYPEDDLTNISKVYGGKKDIFLVAEEGQRIVGTVAIKGEDDGVALLRRLFVHPEYRHKGYGLNLLDEAINFCKHQGYRVIVFRSTDRMTQANNLCQKKGFVERAKVNFGPFRILKFTFDCNSLEKR